jgi:O-antigen/teichoic acid export membrane protein
MAKRFRALPGFPAIRDAGILVSGAIAGQAIVLLLSPLLTRLFTPEQIGALGVFSAAVAIFSVLAPLGYDQSVIGATTRRLALRSVGLSILSSVVIGPVVALAGLVANAALGDESWDPLMILAVIFTGIAAIAVYVSQAWHTRERNFATASRGAFVNMTGRTSLQVVAGAMGLGTLGLVGGEVLGRVGTLLLMDRGRVVCVSLLVTLRGWARTIEQARALRTFPLYQMPSSALETALAWLPLPLVALTYGTEVAGLVTLVQRIGTAPASLIGQSIVQIYHQRAALLIQQDRARLVRGTARAFLLGAIAFLPVLALIGWTAEPLFNVVFGEQWRGAGNVAVVWAPLVLVQIYGQIVARLLALAGGQYVRLIGLSAATLALIGGMLTCDAIGWPFLPALILSISSMTAIYVAWIAAALYLSFPPREDLP